jgi:hypothetical protein
MCEYRHSSRLSNCIAALRHANGSGLFLLCERYQTELREGRQEAAKSCRRSFLPGGASLTAISVLIPDLSQASPRRR